MWSEKIKSAKECLAPFTVTAIIIYYICFPTPGSSGRKMWGAGEQNAKWSNQMDFKGHLGSTQTCHLLATWPWTNYTCKPQFLFRAIQITTTSTLQSGWSQLSALAPAMHLTQYLMNSQCSGNVQCLYDYSPISHYPLLLNYYAPDTFN